MAINYTNLRHTAERLIRENGVAATLTREEETGYDPVADTEQVTQTQYPVDVVLTSVRARDHDFDIEQIKKISAEIQKLSKALISTRNLPIYPLPGDTLDVQGEVWRIGGNNPIRPANDAVLHVCYVFQ